MFFFMWDMRYNCFVRFFDGYSGLKGFVSYLEMAVGIFRESPANGSISQY